MKARRLLLAFLGVSAATRAAGQVQPDWFDAFRGRAFLQIDAGFVGREKAAAKDAPPLFRARWVVLRFAGFAEGERRWWPFRNLLLVTMPSGSRYVLESSFGFVDQSHLDEERPYQRIASGRAAFEVWMSGASREGTDGGPCEGMRERAVAPGGSLTFFLDDLRSRTVRMSLAEISAATFDEGERRDLAVLLLTSVEGAQARTAEAPLFSIQDPLLAVGVAFRDQQPLSERRTITLAPDPEPPSDLAPWRGLAHLPLDLPPFPVLPAEKPIQ